MSKIHAEATQVINARPEEIYEVIADYREGHPAILPKAYFRDLVIEQGGRGAGTVVRFETVVWGAKTKYHSIVSEPEPGRVLVETELEQDLVTTFALEPLNGGTQTQLTITTDFASSPGLKGFIEKLTAPSLMRSIYKKEMQQLTEYLRTKNQNASTATAN